MTHDSILTTAFSQECVVVTALGVDPVGIIGRGLDHPADAGVLKGALVQQGERTSWGGPGESLKFGKFCEKR